MIQSLPLQPVHNGNEEFNIRFIARIEICYVIVICCFHEFFYTSAA